MPVTPTPIDDRKRYASPTPPPTQRHVLVAILEDHTHDTPSMVINSLVCIDTLTSAVYPLIAGADFYAAPTFSPDGTKLAWKAWNHPHMPWYKTYEGERHGFSRADMNRSALEEEATWFASTHTLQIIITNPSGHHMGVEPITRYELIRLEAPL
ncbi:hypothetical protein L210DRAFT_3638560 [Boletus edulis BED1]|uniref:Uncharacterized protein n=1 Tax=Boletus edulis BED1 TaxID=1328754 RepID=A0AAD4C7W8_BOLED|nr:hypothetical protein L210DRAFT_3638560 [Boletus edulis BED1]